ncbi:alpha/beta hydrolase [Kaistella flava (ex Peng et al. 2021)]|uniref:Alpha/beta hydrolase n=1 Tax=Kaistella flava (ex Peng et al. 2021) TaxID=2038776 RepID=A0A7M2YBU5_9FLAO|nr:alpha/beta fold hydrolase [Kaistella flava (ex Peng et al. 2021)]QOW10843.1 alpha/beta hydrolase [Kaistella flava (ex Peng et al. 2021)]
MKTKLLLLLLLVTKVLFVHAQMDDKFYFPSKVLKPIEWENPENLKFAVENDTITGVLLKPNQKAKATIFYFHGAGGNISSYAPILTPLLKDNYQVVLIDFRGYGKSTGTPMHKNIAEDGEKFFNELVKRNDIKNTKIIIYGASIGTQVATLLAKNHQDQIKGLVLEGTVSSFGDIAAVYAPEYKDFLENNFVSPYSAKEDIKSVTKIPKLIIHSKEDKDVPFTEGMLVFNNASESKEFIEFSGEHLYALKYESAKILASLNKMVSVK